MIGIFQTKRGSKDNLHFFLLLLLLLQKVRILNKSYSASRYDNLLTFIFFIFEMRTDIRHLLTSTKILWLLKFIKTIFCCLLIFLVAKIETLFILSITLSSCKLELFYAFFFLSFHYVKYFNCTHYYFLIIDYNYYIYCRNKHITYTRTKKEEILYCLKKIAYQF